MDNIIIRICIFEMLTIIYAKLYYVILPSPANLVEGTLLSSPRIEGCEEKTFTDRFILIDNLTYYNNICI